MFHHLVRDTQSKGRWIAYTARSIRVFLSHEFQSMADLFGFVCSTLSKPQSPALESRCWEELLPWATPPPTLEWVLQSNYPVRVARSVALASVCLNTLLPVYALPTGYQSVAGNVQFEQTGDTLNVTTGAQKAIATYQSFNVAGHETVNFNLPSRQAAILNRVIGGDPSQIMGRVNSNGQVYMVNPAGIVFGQGAQVNVGGLHASTLNIQDQDFLAGNNQFTREGPAASITNQGTISGEAVTLIGSVIDNQGTITVPGGQVNLAVGDSVTMVVDNNLAVSVTVNEGLQQAVSGYSAAISNAGTISATGGVITAQAKLQGGLYTQAINNTGVLEAQGLGDVILTATSSAQEAVVRNTGVIDVSGTDATPNGGDIALTGDYLIQRGEIVAEGAENGVGGTITLVSTQGTLLTTGSVTSAKGAGDHSTGGTVTIWSDNDTFFRDGAVIDVSGGLMSGDAGFVEVSGKENVYFQGQARGYAQDGQAGRILIDPTDIVIDNAGGDTVDGGDAAAAIDETFAEGNATETYNPQNGGSFAGFGDIWLQATNDITINSAFNTSTATGNASVSLRLEANNNINLNAAVTTNNAAITLASDKDNNGSGTIALNANVTSGGGAITLTGAGTTGTGNINATAGALSITTSGANRPISTGNMTGGNVTVQTEGNNSGITITGDVNSSGSLTLRSTGAGGWSSYTNSNVAITGNVTVSSAAGQNIYLQSGSYSDLNLGGTLSIPTMTNKNLFISTFGGTFFSNGFFNQSLPFQLIDLATYANNMPITITGNVGQNGTTGQVYVQTYGTSSPITITGDVSSWAYLYIIAEYSDITVGGNLNMNTWPGSQELKLIAGWSSIISSLSEPWLYNASANMTIGGNINCTVNAAPNWAQVYILTGTGNVFSKAFFNQTFNMYDLVLQSAGDNMPITVTGDFSTSGFGSSNGFLIGTRGTNSPITYNGNISVNGGNSDLLLDARQSDVTVTGNITYINASTNDVKLNAGWSGSTLLNANATFNVGGTLSVADNAFWPAEYTFSTGDGNLFSQNYFTADHTSGFVNLRTGADNMPIALGGNFTGRYGLTVDTRGDNSDISVAAGKSLSTSFAWSTLSLNTVNSDIGSLGNPIASTSGELSMNSTTGDAFITNTGTTILLASSVGGDFILSNNNNITVSGAVSADNLTLQTTANNGNITLGANVTGTTSFNLSANGSGNITRTAGTLSGGFGTLTSTSGNIGSVGTPLQTNLTSLTANTSGNIYLTETDALSLNASSAGGAFSLTAGGDITLDGLQSADTLSLTTTGSLLDNHVGNDITTTAGASLTAATIGTTLNALDIQIGGGLLSISLTGVSGGVSASLMGTVAPTDTLTLLGSPLGQVWYNGSLFWTPPVPINLTTDLGDNWTTLSYQANTQPERFHVTSSTILLNPYIVPRRVPQGVLYQQEWAQSLEDLHPATDDDIRDALDAGWYPPRLGALPLAVQP